VRLVSTRTMGLGIAAFAVLGLVGGCAGSSDVDSDTDAFAAPDITGRYDLQVQGTNGCNETPSLITDWAPGPLVVSGTAASLTFDFLDDVVMTGSVDATFAVQFGGTVSDPPWTIGVFASASVTDEDAKWVMSGTFEGTADDDGVASNDCTIEAPFTATRLGS
jgi:hypothetical protein